MGAIKTVLVVDDDEKILALFRRGLQREDKIVLTTTDAVQARRLAKLERPDLAVVDMHLGATNGIDLIRDLKKDRPGLKVALMSVYLSVPSTVDAVKAGADLVVFKPIAVREILRRIEEETPHAQGDREERPTLARVEYEYIHRTLSDCNNNITKAARVLGIPRQSLQRRLKKPAPRS